MTTAVIALVAALAALAIVVLAGVASRRAQSGSETRITSALEQMGARMETLSEELSGAIERAREDGLRARALGEIGGTLDVEETLARTADAVAGLRGVDAAIVRAVGLAGEPLVAAVGIRADEAERQLVSGPPDGRANRAVALAYLYPDREEPPGALRSGVAVPLESGGEPLGFVAAYSHDPAPRISEDALARLEAIAAAAGPAIDTARRFEEVNATGDHDTLTGLVGRRGFLDTLTREVARAARFERSLTLLVLDLDDFAALNARLGQLGGDDVLRTVTRIVRGAVRDTDGVFRSGGDELAIILPESTRIDAEGLFARTLATLQREQLGVTASGGIAQLRPDDDAVSILERAETALAHAKTVGKGTAA